jgi:bacterioferritin-associated ferredoxin
MIICICKTISENDVMNAVLNGCETFEEMIIKLGREPPNRDCKICHAEMRKYFEGIKENI